MKKQISAALAAVLIATTLIPSQSFAIVAVPPLVIVAVPHRHRHRHRPWLTAVAAGPGVQAPPRAASSGSRHFWQAMISSGARLAVVTFCTSAGLGSLSRCLTGTL